MQVGCRGFESHMYPPVMGSVRSMALGASCYTYLGVAARKGVAGSNPVDSTSLGSNGEYSGSIPVNGGPGCARQLGGFDSHPIHHLQS